MFTVTGQNKLWLPCNQLFKAQKTQTMSKRISSKHTQFNYCWGNLSITDTSLGSMENSQLRSLLMVSYGLTAMILNSTKKASLCSWHFLSFFQVKRSNKRAGKQLTRSFIPFPRFFWNAWGVLLHEYLVWGVQSTSQNHEKVASFKKHN